MPGMRGLTVIVTTGDGERFAAALTLASAQAALGARARVYCHDHAVALLAADMREDRAVLIALARESGVTLIACQTGLALTGLDLGDLIDDIETGGMVGLLADLGEDRLVTF